MDALDDVVIDRFAAEFDDDLIALRRDIHRHPELAGDERRTAALVAERLLDAGLDISTGVGGHGVVAVLHGAGAGRTVAYRADMDAVAFGDGAAHLCGHDLHTAIGVGVAQVLARLRERLVGRVIFIFQPAEETLTGAQEMIADGVLHRTEPDEIYALHCAPSPVGTFAVMPGFGHPGLDRFQIELTGPDATRDAERLIAEIGAMSTVAYPQTDEQFSQMVADMQRPDGPLARFVLTGTWLTVDGERTEVHGWTRCWPDDRYRDVRDDLRRLAMSTVGACIDFPEPPFPAMVCSPDLSRAMASHLRSLVCVDAVFELHAAYPFNGEDFALFLQQVPGAMAFLGVADHDADIRGIPHTPDFAADERAIGVAVRSMVSFLASRLGVSSAAAGTARSFARERP